MANWDLDGSKCCTTAAWTQWAALNDVQMQNRGKLPILLWGQCHQSTTLLLLPRLSKHTNEGMNSMQFPPKPLKNTRMYLIANEWIFDLHFWHYLVSFPSSIYFPNSLYPTAAVENRKFTHVHGIFSLWLKRGKFLKYNLDSLSQWFFTYLVKIE